MPRALSGVLVRWISLEAEMAAEICPTITVVDSDQFRLSMDQLSTLSNRIHIDLADGTLSPSKLIELDKVWWPANISCDLHVMYKQPFLHMETFVSLSPRLLIFQAEAEGQFNLFAAYLRRHGIQVGVAVSASTPLSSIEPGLENIDHVLIFSGNLGYYGGQANLALLDKVKPLKEKKPSLEIGWDGGIDNNNVKQIASSGVDVLNVGGTISRSENPSESYAKLKEKLPD